MTETKSLGCRCGGVCADVQARGCKCWGVCACAGTGLQGRGCRAVDVGVGCVRTCRHGAAGVGVDGMLAEASVRV
eukprot:592310-Prorocentrum_minimum.AAC.1